MQMTLPEHHHKDDARWLRQTLASIPHMHRANALAGYSKIYLQAHDAEPLEHCKENAARFAANTRLRAYIAKLP